VMIYGDSGDTNGLFRIQMDSISDSFGTGARTFLGDGGIDIFLGTSNSSYTPGNTYIALNHSGEISMGAGSATKHFILSTSGDATFTGTGTFSGGGNTLVLKKGTGSPAIALAGTSDQATGLIEGVSGGGVKIYTSTGTLSSPAWGLKLSITPTEGIKFGSNAISIIGTEGVNGFHYIYASSTPKIYLEANGIVAFLNSGGVAVGKSSASSALDVQATGANGIVLSADSTDTNNSGRLFFMRTGGEGWNIFNNSGNLSFRSNAIPGNTSGSERMRLDSSYNLTLNNGLTVAGTAAISGKLTANATNGAIQIGGSGYSLNPSGMMIGQYVSSMGYIQAPSGGRVEIWNGATENVATFFNDKSTSFYGSISASSSISASGGIHTAKYTRVNDLYEYVKDGPYNSSNASIQVFRQFHDSVNWCTGGQLIEITCHGYAHGEFDHAIYFVRYGYGGNTASVDTRLSPITNRITAPYWGAATLISGNDYYRDLMFDTQSYRTYKIVIKTTQPLTPSATPGGGYGNYVWVFGY